MESRSQSLTIQQLDDLCTNIQAAGAESHKNLAILKNYLLRIFVSQTAAQMEIDEAESSTAIAKKAKTSGSEADVPAPAAALKFLLGRLSNDILESDSNTMAPILLQWTLELLKAFDAAEQVPVEARVQVRLRSPFVQSLLSFIVLLLGDLDIFSTDPQKMSRFAPAFQMVSEMDFVSVFLSSSFPRATSFFASSSLPSSSSSSSIIKSEGTVQEEEKKKSATQLESSEKFRSSMMRVRRVAEELLSRKADESVENSWKFQTSLLELAEVQSAERVAAQLGSSFETVSSKFSQQEVDRWILLCCASSTIYRAIEPSLVQFLENNQTSSTELICKWIALIFHFRSMDLHSNFGLRILRIILRIPKDTKVSGFDVVETLFQLILKKFHASASGKSLASAFAPHIAPICADLHELSNLSLRNSALSDQSRIVNLYRLLKSIGNFSSNSTEISAEILFQIFLRFDFRRFSANLFTKMSHSLQSHRGSESYRVFTEKVVSFLRASCDAKPLSLILSNLHLLITEEEKNTFSLSKKADASCFFLSSNSASAATSSPALNTSSLISSHWELLFSLLLRSTTTATTSENIPSSSSRLELFSLLKFSAPHLRYPNRIDNACNLAVEFILSKFRREVISAGSVAEENFSVWDDEEKLNYVKELLIFLGQMSPIACSMIIDQLFDFIFSDHAVGLIRTQRGVTAQWMSTPTAAAQFAIKPLGISFQKRLLDEVISRPSQSFSGGPTSKSLSRFKPPQAFQEKSNSEKNEEELLLQRNQQTLIEILSRITSKSTMDVLTNHLCARIVSQDLMPTMEEYAAVLPRRTSFERDRFVFQLFQTHPIILPIVQIIATVPQEVCDVRIQELLRSALANAIGSWNCESVTSASLSRHYLSTCQLLEIFRSSSMCPQPLSDIAEILSGLASGDVVLLLMSVWALVRDYPPSASQYNENGDRLFPPSFSIDTYMVDLRTILRNNVEKLTDDFTKFYMLPQS